MADMGKILIADDEETFLHATAELLREEGYECGCAPDAFSATEMLSSEDYDLIIADINMPGNVNMEFVHTLVRDFKGISAIMVTGYPSLRTAIESIQLPVMSYLIKPIDFDELLKHVKTSILQTRAYRNVEEVQVRLEKWREDMDALRELLGSPYRSENGAQVDAVMHLALRNIIGSLADIVNIATAVHAGNGEERVCQLINCPMQQEVKVVVRDAIEVLEKTKNSFKSKELAKLRKKLQAFLEANE